MQRLLNPQLSQLQAAMSCHSYSTKPESKTSAATHRHAHFEAAAARPTHQASSTTPHELRYDTRRELTAPCRPTIFSQLLPATVTLTRMLTLRQQKNTSGQQCNT
jgi:hypothetical protein